MIEGILAGLMTVLTPINLLMVFVGCVAGTFIGMLPGLGPISAIALMIPITYGFDPASGMIFCEASVEPPDPWDGPALPGRTVRVAIASD